MRVLLIAHPYPPDAASGAQRVRHVTAALRDAGMEVCVIAAGGDAADDDALVERVRPWPDGTALLRGLAALRPRRRGPERQVPQGSGNGSPPPGDPPPGDPPDPLDPGPTLRRWALSLLRFANGDIGFAPAAVRAALRPDRPPPDIVYTSGPPISVHLAGLLVHAMTARPWVAEFRDPWVVAGDPYRSPAVRSRMTDALERVLYRRCLSAAEEVIAVSRGIAAELACDRARERRAAPHVIRNGIPVLAGRRGPRLDGPLRVLHLGNVYGFRDPRPFFEAIASLREAAGWTPRTLEIRFIGSPPAASVLARVARLGIDDLVRFDGWVDHAEGQRLVANADLLLLLAQGQPLQVPNKLYEYLGSRKPILAFADERGETADLLRRAGAGVLIHETDTAARARERVREALALALDPGRADSTVDGERLEAWTTAAQLARLPAIVRAAASR